MKEPRYLIVNADDFGQSAGVNRGVMQAHEKGIVTSASLMVRWPSAKEAGAYGWEHSDLSLGLHFDLGEWVYRGESWRPLYEVVPPDDAEAVAEEVERQLAAFRRLVGKDPTHIDSHQHAHHREPLRSLLIEAANRLGIPLRGFCPEVGYRGDFYGQARNGAPLPEVISVEGLIQILTTLPPGYTELGCHPGLGDDLDTMYRRDRAEEVRVLCDPRVLKALAAEEIICCSFAALVGNGTDFSHPLRNGDERG